MSLIEKKCQFLLTTDWSRHFKLFLCKNISLSSHCARLLCVCSHVLVYKLGGTSLSVTVLQVTGGMFRVLNTHTDHNIGGENFTQALAQHLAAEFKR